MDLSQAIAGKKDLAAAEFEKSLFTHDLLDDISEAARDRFSNCQKSLL